MTPSSLFSFFSIRAAQEAQVIPPMTSSTLWASASWSGVVVVLMRFLSSCTALAQVESRSDCGELVFASLVQGGDHLGVGE